MTAYRLPLAPDAVYSPKTDPRQRRHREVRAKTVPVRSISKRELDLGRTLYPEAVDAELPLVRAECAGGPRPCPLVSCQWHLYLDVSPTTGAIKFNFPDLEVDELEESCALDFAERGGASLEEVGKAMNVTRERIRQLEEKALAKLRAVDGFVDFARAVIET